ncbi:MAG TPA: carboxypeptidase regulatory-like domain-containing protein [Terracidiphilus sp.]|nr:carboxypeptidase regulatory-like domain-containing protein [Terracidiphilus sp.]
MKRILPLWLGLVALAMVPALAQQQAVPTGKIHGQVINPTGAPQTSGTVTAQQTTRAASGPGLSAQTQDQGVFKVDQNGEFSGNVPPGSYTLIFRQPDTPPDKQVDHLDNVVVTAGQTTEANIDMSRPEYIANLPPEEKQQLEEMKKHNSEALKANEVIKHLNADLKTVAQDIRDADGASAQAQQELGAGATKQAVDAKADEIKAAKYSDAERLMTTDTAAKPDASILWARLGQAQLGLKKYDDAEASFKKALDLESTSKKPLAEVQGLAQSGLGEALARAGKTDDAVAAFDTAAKINPPQAEFYLKNETVIFFQQGNSAAQVAAADKAIAADTNPNDPNLAVVYYLKGQGLVGNATMAPDPKNPKAQIIVLPPGCAEAYQKYLELAPNGPYAADAKGILAQAGQSISSSYKAGKK